MRRVLSLLLLGLSAARAKPETDCRPARQTHRQCKDAAQAQADKAKSTAEADKAACLSENGCGDAIPPTCQQSAIKDGLVPLLEGCGAAEWERLTSDALDALGNDRGAGDGKMAADACPNRASRRAATKCLRGVSAALKKKLSAGKKDRNAALKACDRAYPKECKQQDQQADLDRLDRLCGCGQRWMTGEREVETALAACWTNSKKPRGIPELQRFAAIVCHQAMKLRVKVDARQLGALRSGKPADVAGLLAGSSCGGSTARPPVASTRSPTTTLAPVKGPVQLKEPMIVVMGGRYSTKSLLLNLAGDTIVVLKTSNDGYYDTGGYVNVPGADGRGVRGLVCGGGYWRNRNNTCWYVEPRSLRLTPAPTLPDVFTQGALLYSGKAVYAFGAFNTRSYFNGLKLNDGATSWRILPFVQSHPQRHLFASAVLSGGEKLWLMLGYPVRNFANAEEMDLTTEQWTDVPNFENPGLMHGAGAVECGGKLLLCGGSETPSSKCFLRRGSEWVPTSSMRCGRYIFGLICIRDQVYAVGGYGSCAPQTVERLDMTKPEAGWTLLQGRVPERLYCHATLGVA